MEWVSLILWALIASVALPLGLAAVAHPMLGLQALAVTGGLAISILWAFDIGNEDTAWIAFGCALVAIFALTVAAAWVVSSDRDVSFIGQTGEEVVASVIGLVLPLVVVAGLLMVAIANDALAFT